MASLDPTAGHIVAGVPLDDHRFLGRMSGAQLLEVAVDPRKTEDLKQVALDSELDAVRRIRQEVQRLFEGAKARNVEPYARYLVALKEGQSGMAPPIILFTKERLDIEEFDDGAARTLVPYGTQLVAIDGETQLAARFVAATINGETKKENIPIVLCHGQTIEWARQVFHDLNLLGVRPNAAIGISMDERDPLTFVAREVEKRVPFFTGRVNAVRRQLRKRDTDVVTITALRGACVTLAEGIGGVKHGAKPVPIEQGRVKHLTAVAVEWFDAVAKAVGSAIEDRERTLASAPTVLAAIGAMGHQLVPIADAGARAAKRDEILDQLRLVRWDKGDAWAGVAGKVTPKGRFAVGGSKETAYAVYRALTDRTSDGYERIRISSAALV